MRVLTIISGILLVLTGVFCFANPGETFLSLAFVLGLIMVLNSIIQGIAYWWGRSGNQNDNNGWILTEAILTFVLGVLVLSSQIAADVAIPMVFGLWVMFSGVLRVVTATMIDRANKKSNFAWTLIIGLLCAVGGLYAFLNPIIAGLAIAVLLGIMFVLQGISALELGIHMPHEKKVKKPKQKKEKKQKHHGEEIAGQEEIAQPAEESPAEVKEEPATETAATAKAVETVETTEPPEPVVNIEEERINAVIKKAEEDQIAEALHKAAALRKATPEPPSEDTTEDEPDFSKIFKF